MLRALTKSAVWNTSSSLRALAAISADTTKIGLKGSVQHPAVYSLKCLRQCDEGSLFVLVVPTFSPYSLVYRIAASAKDTPQFVLGSANVLHALSGVLPEGGQGLDLHLSALNSLLAVGESAGKVLQCAVTVVSAMVDRQLLRWGNLDSVLGFFRDLKAVEGGVAADSPITPLLHEALGGVRAARARGCQHPIACPPEGSCSLVPPALSYTLPLWMPFR